MANKIYSKNLDTFNKVITSLATDAVADVEGISLLGTKNPAELFRFTFSLTKRCRSICL